MTCEKYRRTHFVEVGACCGKWVQPDPAQVRIDDLAIERAEQIAEILDGAEELSPEQALRVHVADLLTDVDSHFDGCGNYIQGDGTCTCLIGRLHWAIDAEQVQPDQTSAAIDVVARELTEQMLDPMDLGDMWDDYPEIGEDDWRSIVARARDRAEAAKAEVETYKAAYAHLQARAEAWAQENDPA
jgi:hypothetical protein